IIAALYITLSHILRLSIFVLRPSGNLAPTGEVGAKRRVRILSAGRLFWRQASKFCCPALKNSASHQGPSPFPLPSGRGYPSPWSAHMVLWNEKIYSLVVGEACYQPLPHFVVGEGQGEGS